MQLRLLAKNAIGLDLSNRENTYGCVETVWTMCKLLGIPFKEKFSTIKAYAEFIGSSDWVEVLKPEPNAIIITPTESNSRRGHIGVIIDGGKIVSNNSHTFLVDDHIPNYLAWCERYKGMKIRMFKYEPAPMTEEEADELSEQLSYIEKAIAKLKISIAKLLTINS